MFTENSITCDDCGKTVILEGWMDYQKIHDIMIAGDNRWHWEEQKGGLYHDICPMCYERMKNDNG